MFILFGMLFQGQNCMASVFGREGVAYGILKRPFSYLFARDFDFSYVPDSASIRDLLPLKDGFLIAMLGNGHGLISSADQGDSWSKYGDDSIYFRQFIIDDNNVIWGLDYSRDYAYLYRSFDTGKTWHFFKLDISKMFPIKIISKYYEPLKVVTINRNIYKLKGDSPLDNWLLVGRDDSLLFLEGLVSANFVVRNKTIYKKRSEEECDSIFQIKEFEPLDILAKDDTLFVSGTDHRQSSVFGYFLNGKLHRIEIKEPYALLGIRLDARGRIWAFGDKGIYLYEDGRLVRKY
ncbi:hypothetical protein [Niabella aurantiaca]|uniref:hypothetical protein n=1 Tax=Niabella aurantiaca TaxID=379900 RepID=UPI00039A4175|nr:hypothetical protein [Niabella aurantiaca]